MVAIAGPWKSPAGYSGKSLPDKLGYRAGMEAAFLAVPAALTELTEAAAFARIVRAADWTESLPAATFDLIHAFTTSRAEVERHLPGLRTGLKPDGMIWVSWPKKAAKMASDVTEDIIRATALTLDLVDVKVAAIDAVWSGLKLVIRKERRGFGDERP